MELQPQSVITNECLFQFYVKVESASIINSRLTTSKLEDVFKEPVVAGTPQKVYNDKYNFHHPLEPAFDIDGSGGRFWLAPAGSNRSSNSEYGRESDGSWHK